jgi:TRAP-type C4-dicarboxylate transport system permease large subunit
MNIFFASAMFSKPLSTVAASVSPAFLAILVGSLLIALLPGLSTALPKFLGLMA